MARSSRARICPPQLVGVELLDLQRRWTPAPDETFARDTGDPLSFQSPLAALEWSHSGLPLDEFNDQPGVALLARAGGGKTAELWRWAERDPSSKWIDAGLIDTASMARTEIACLATTDVVYMDGLDESPCNPRALLTEIAQSIQRGAKFRLAVRPSCGLSGGRRPVH